MVRELPTDYDFTQFKVQAKDLLKAHKQGDAKVCEVLRLHYRLAGKSDQEILATKVGLQEVQHALALAHGFASWGELRSRYQLKKGAVSEGRTAVDIENLFGANRDVLGSHNISGVKVLYMQAQQAGATEVDFARAHAAYGLGLAFCYKRGDYLPMFCQQEGLIDRALPILGCRFNVLWPHNAEEAWEFLKEGIGVGRIVKLPAGEHSIIHAYEEAGGGEKRYVHARGVGGPTLEGRIAWKDFSEHVGGNQRGPGGEMCYVAEKTAAFDVAEAVKVLAGRMVDWQVNHPGMRYRGYTRHEFGITAFERYYADLLNPDVDIPEDYSYGIAVNFQRNARAALADYFAQAASSLRGGMKKSLAEVAADYRIIADRFEVFVKEGLGQKRDPAGIERTVGEALKAERRVLERMVKLA